MTNSTIYKFIGVAFLFFATPAWETKVQTSHTYTDAGDHTTPLAGQNYIRLYCESEDNANKAMGAGFGWTWLPMDLTEYCQKHVAHYASSPTDLWNRDRQYLGCIAREYTETRKVYRCFLFEESAEYLEVRETLKKQLSYLDEKSATICKAKELEISAGAGQRYGDIDAALKIAQDEERAAEAAELAAKETADRAKAELDEMLIEVTERTKLMTALATMVDSAFEKFEVHIQSHFAKVKNADEITAALNSRLNNSDHSYESLNRLQKEASTNLSEALTSVCQPQQFEIEIDGLRGQIAHMSAIVDALERHLETVVVPAEFTKDKEYLAHKTRELRKVADARSSLYNPSLDLITERPYVCEKLNIITNGLTKAAHLAKSKEEITATTGVITDFKAALEKIETEASVVAALELVVGKASDIEAELMGAIYKGQASQAKQIADTFVPTVHEVIYKLSLLNPNLDLKRIESAIEPIKNRVRFVIDSRLTLPNAPLLLNTRLREIESQIMKLEMLSNSNPDLALVWAAQKDSILTTLNTKVGGEIQRPELNDWPAISQFETKLNHISALLAQLSQAVKR